MEASYRYPQPSALRMPNLTHYLLLLQGNFHSKTLTQISLASRFAVASSLSELPLSTLHRHLQRGTDPVTTHLPTRACYSTATSRVERAARLIYSCEQGLFCANIYSDSIAKICSSFVYSLTHLLTAANRSPAIPHTCDSVSGHNDKGQSSIHSHTPDMFL